MGSSGSIPNRFGPAGWTADRLPSLAGKTYVITGTTAGTGFQAARTFLSKGAAVVMLNRNAKKSEEAEALLREEYGAAANVSTVVMDLGQLSSVRKAAAELLQKTPRIDALICNGAIAQVATRELTPDGFESQFGVNHMGHFLLCGLVFDRIAESEGRIVVVASGGYKLGLKRIKFEDINWEKGYVANTAYSQSKLAQMMFAYELDSRARAAGKKIQVHVCHPGASRTSLINKKAGCCTRCIWGCLSSFAQSAELGSWPSVMCATEDGLEPEKYWGPTKHEMTGPIGENVLEPHALDREARTKLWSFSEEKSGFTWSL